MKHRKHGEFMLVSFGDIELQADNLTNNILRLFATNLYLATNHLPGLGQEILKLEHPSIDEVIATRTEIMIRHQHHDVVQLLQELALSKLVLSDTTSQEWRLPVLFTDGDWQRVVEYTGMAPEQYQQKISKLKFQVCMYGFIPGFTYLSGLPGKLQVPRKKSPAKKTAAGSVAIGGDYLGVYAVASPAGWNIIGKTPLRILEIPKLPPVSFAIGDQAVIEVIDQSAYQALLEQQFSLSEYQRATD